MPEQFSERLDTATLCSLAEAATNKPHEHKTVTKEKATTLQQDCNEFTYTTAIKLREGKKEG
jgi:hypothetical protein